MVALVVGVAIGWFAGRAMLEHDWENPLATISQADESRAVANDADPTPKAGAKILPKLPLRKARERAAKRIRDILAREPGKHALRIAVNGGGCSGFQYEFQLTGEAAADEGIERTVAGILADVKARGDEIGRAHV